MKDALTESGDCWKPAEMQFIKWTTEGAVKGDIAEVVDEAEYSAT